MSTPLRKYREEFNPKVPQEVMAQLSGVRINTYRKAESGKNINFTTAMHILDALNKLRGDNGLEPVTVFDLGLTIV
jgi:hypothetical protein